MCQLAQHVVKRHFVRHVMLCCCFTVSVHAARLFQQDVPRCRAGAGCWLLIDVGSHEMFWILYQACPSPPQSGTLDTGSYIVWTLPCYDGWASIHVNRVGSHQDLIIPHRYHIITSQSQVDRDMTNYFRHYQLRILTICNCYSISTTNEDNKLYVIKDGLSFIRTDDSTHFQKKQECMFVVYLLLTLCWRLCLVSMVSLHCSAHYCSLWCSARCDASYLRLRSGPG